MATNYITVRGQIKDGKLEVKLPENVTDGEAQVIVPVEAELLPTNQEPLRVD